MPTVHPGKLVSLQSRPKNVRNICILAHVDHGKTTLSDYLLATNGIVSASRAGEARHLDNRPDEQERGITMKSSAVSLYLNLKRRKTPEGALEAEEYLINLIDSPGHIDFSSEVSTASRLCDGALVLVDAVEGVCSQTVTVLHQAWVEKLKPLLVINKMDRLITELQLSPGEAYTHLAKTIEQVNAILGSFFQGERMVEDLNWREKMEARVAATAAKEAAAAAAAAAAATDKGDGGVAETFEYREKDDEDLYFAPEKENVIFCSALDGWAFTPRQFAVLYEKKLGMKRSVLEKVLWGNFYLDPKTKKVIGPKHLRGRNLKPIFVQLVLEQIWTVYQVTTAFGTQKGDPARLDAIIKSLGITLAPRDARSEDPRRKLTAVFSNWLPLATALLVSVVEHIPSPLAAQPERLPALIDNSPGASHVDPKIRTAMINLQATKTDPVVVYVSKMVSVPVANLPENRRAAIKNVSDAMARTRQLREEASRLEVASTAPVELSEFEKLKIAASAPKVTETKEANAKESGADAAERLIGFARIYAGVLNVGDEVYVLSPRYNPAHIGEKPEVKKVTITALYMLMGAELEQLDSVPAGVVFGIGGLEGSVLKSGTICSQAEGAVNLASVSTGSKPIFQVALLPKNPLELEKMVTGLKLLVQSDPCAEYEHTKAGEHLLSTAGELHLERCLVDLKERFSHCEIEAGEPIVPYRETTVQVQGMKPPLNPDLGRGIIVVTPVSGLVSIKLGVRPLPKNLTEVLIKYSSSIVRMLAEKQAQDAANEKPAQIQLQDGLLSTEELKLQLKKALNTGKSNDIWSNIVDKLAAFGPKLTGPNILVDATQDEIFPKVFGQAQEGRNNGATTSGLKATDLTDKIIYAFQLATQSGPLCHEPIQGIAVVIEHVTLSPQLGESNIEQGRLTSEILSAVQQGIRSGFLDWSPRMMLAMYSVEIQASTEVIGRVYDVLTRRSAKVVAEEMKEGTPFFSIQARLPVAESFGFSTEVRKRTSGAAQPQLIFSGYDMLDQDPFWVPFTEDDLEDLGELADKENVAKRYMDLVRRKKGLLVEGRKVRRDAEKQKTLKR